VSLTPSGAETIRRHDSPESRCTCPVGAPDLEVRPSDRKPNFPPIAEKRPRQFVCLASVPDGRMIAVTAVGDVGTRGAGAAAAIGANRRVDGHGRAAQLSRQVSSTDKAKLDEYLTSVREVDKRIERMRVDKTKAEDRAAVRPLFTMERPANGLPEDFRDHTRLMCDIIAMAFQTYKTRIASLILARDLSSLIYPFIGAATSRWRKPSPRSRP
jgi:hypothetical protein